MEEILLKLLYCTECHTVFNLRKHLKSCECGKTSGIYQEDGLHAEYEGPCIPLGFANGDFRYAVEHQPEVPMGKKFTAFVIEKQCPTMHKRDT
jgi:hypothetical protein